MEKTWKNKCFTLIAPPDDVKSGKKRLLTCNALETIKDLHEKYSNKSFNAFWPWITNRQWISNLPLFEDAVYIEPEDFNDFEACEYIAKFKDNSQMIWLGAYKEWGFSYGLDIKNPFVITVSPQKFDPVVTKFAYKQETRESSVTEPVEEGFGCG